MIRIVAAPAAARLVGNGPPATARIRFRHPLPEAFSGFVAASAAPTGPEDDRGRRILPVNER